MKKVSPTYRGVCVGGPYDGLPLVVTGADETRQAFDPATGRGLPAQQASIVQRPCKFGTYLFDHAGHCWVWDDSSISDRR